MTKSHALEAKYEAEDKETKEETESTNLEKLPNPTGWRLLVMPFAVKEKTEGGEIRLLNDDEVLGTIDDPNDILHAF
jgi:hypothetical protein